MLMSVPQKTLSAIRSALTQMVAIDAIVVLDTSCKMISRVVKLVEVRKYFSLSPSDNILLVVIDRSLHYMLPCILNDLTFI